MEEILAEKKRKAQERQKATLEELKKAAQDAAKDAVEGDFIIFATDKYTILYKYCLKKFKIQTRFEKKLDQHYRQRKMALQNRPMINPYPRFPNEVIGELHLFYEKVSKITQEKNLDSLFLFFREKGWR